MSIRENFEGDYLNSPLELTGGAYLAAGMNEGLQAALKRGVDLALGAVVLLALSPVLALTALWVWIDSPGPVFFRQTRYGLYGQAFDILKFRTMRVLENGGAVIQAKRGDPRITRAGAFLRRWSIDELPQLLNVLSGEMSLVGPRPHAVAHDKHYGALIANYRLRQSVKPGITGWAQVNGHRGETPTTEHMQIRIDHDVWYALNGNLTLDLEILARTAVEVFRQRNAY